MSIRFSRVQAIAPEKAAIFLVGGIPANQYDLSNWTAFHDFCKDLKPNETVTIYAETFEYGGEEPNDATPEEVAYIYMRQDKRPDFIETRTKKIGESSFVMRLKK